MKIVINEKKKVPLTYKYMEVYREKKGMAEQEIPANPIKNSKIQSEFHHPSVPFKKLARLL